MDAYLNRVLKQPRLQAEVTASETDFRFAPMADI